MTIIERLRALACNLYWTWRPELIEIFRDLNPQLWREVNHNPVRFLNEMDDEELQEKSATLALDARISQAFREMRAYQEDRDTWGDRYAGSLFAKPVAYFSAEFGLHESLPIYSGGLGVLAGDHLKSASDLRIPLVGVGLFYAEGYFRQTLDDEYMQQEEYAFCDVDDLPLQRCRNDDGELVKVSVRTRQADICASLWYADVGRCRLVLLDTNVEDNADEHRGLTSQLYGGGDEKRILQELVLGVGGLRALRALDIHPGAVHLNEGHSAFAPLEYARDLMEREGRDFHAAYERTVGRVVFTTHTPVAAGHDRFAPDLVERTLGPLREQLNLDEKGLLDLGRVDTDSEDESFCMTVLGMKMSRHRNAVSARHGRVSRENWQPLWPGVPQEQVPIGHITNGVHVSSWLAVSLAPMYERHLGPDWPEQIDELRDWDLIDQIDDVEFWEQHQVQKAHLVEYVRRCLETQQAGDRQATQLDPSVLTIGFARRFAEYKRPHLLLHDRDRLASLVGDNDRPLQIIFAGKAHPANDAGKELIQRLAGLMDEDPFARRVVFIEDHDMNVTRHLVQGCDLWLNTPRRPMEACGTSGMKTILNGGLNCSILDGWWDQAYDGDNGFAIGRGEEFADSDRQDAHDAAALYDVLEREVIPLFYERDDDGVPRNWVFRQKRAIRTLAWRFSAHRMVMDYTRTFYMPAVGANTRG